MDVSNFMHPLEAVQVRSVLSYVILLSDFLIQKNALNITDLNKPIPTVNAMYKYLVGPNAQTAADIDDIKLEKLSKYLIRNSDLYGSKRGEQLDPHFSQSLFNLIINSLVFNKYGNVYGFVAEVVRTSNYTTEEEVLESILRKLSNERFENEHGPDSKLDKTLCKKIYQEYILPLFPISRKNIDIFSIDYIYAQAGSIFFQSMSNASVDFITQNELMHEVYYENNNFDEYIRVAHIVEQLVTMKKIDNSLLRIFAIPALLRYVYEKKEDLRNKTIASIMNNRTDWKNAFNNLFSNLSDFHQTVDEANDKNYGNIFLQALQGYENKSSLARSNLKRNCPTLNNNDMENVAEEYLKCTKDCFCTNNGKRINLTSIDTLFRDQFNNIVEKYAAYEREALKSIFPDEIKTLMNNQKLEVKKGLFENYYIADLGPTVNNAKSMQAVPEQHDILEFYFPETEKSIYYGLMRKGFEVSLINETYDIKFREKLGLYSNTYFLSWKFAITLKGVHETFDDFLRNMTKERVKIFKRHLTNYKIEKKEQPWWKELLVSLIPFYTCTQAIKENNVNLAEMACSIDTIFLIPGALEVSMALKELTEVTSESLTRISLSSIKAATARLSFRAAVRSVDRILVEEGMKFVEAFTPQLFKNVGIAVLRMVDPGFELLYSLSESGLKLIGKFVELMEKKYSGSLLLMQETLTNAVSKITSLTEKIPGKLDVGVFKNKEVYYNSLEKNFGYGYKFIYSPEEKVLSLRSVEEFPDKVPVFHRVGVDNSEEVLTFKLNSKTREVETTKVHIVHGVQLKSAEREFNIRFKNVHDKMPCGGGKQKRSPDGLILCFRTSLLEKKKTRLEEAVEIATKNGALSRIQVETELRQYLFLEESEKMELDFVNDWKKSNFLKVPVWSEEYKIALPNVFNELRYNVHFDESEIPRWTKYHPKYHAYKISKASKHVSFEDFVNIDQYMGIYYGEIAENTDRGRDMRKSLYRLAIRQSDDPIEEYAKTLYRGERRSTYDIKDLFYPVGKEFEFTKFTSTSTSDIIASGFRKSLMTEEAEVEYVLEFEGTYLRANVERVFVSSEEKETILLPGSKFRIKDVKESGDAFGIKSVTVKMSYKPESKLQDIKRVMKELKKLEDLGA